MANPGIGNKFVSVNLNKSYGQSLPHPQPPTSSYYAGRSRVGGGLVVLSKPKNVQKTVPKLSVPRPLNLPSLRKEHERFDFSSNTHLGGGPSSGSRATSATLGWTKPSTIAEKESSGIISPVGSPDFDGPIGTTYQSGAYKPPSFHHTVSSNTSNGSRSSYATSSGRSLVFRGEDFPSLGAKIPPELTLPKQKADPHQKPKQTPNLELTKERKSFAGVSSGDLNSGPSGNINGVKENHGGTSPLKTSNIISKSKKDDEYVKEVLPIVHLDQRSDWADDERDTGHGARDGSRVQPPQKGEHYWDTAGISKDSVSNSRGRRDDDNLKHFPSEMAKYDLNRQEIRKTSRDGNDGISWRGSRFHNEGYGSRDTIMKDGQFAATFVETGNVNSRKWNTSYERKDTGYGQGGKQWRHTAGLHGSWYTDKSTRHDIDQSSRNRGDIMRPRSPFSPTTRGSAFSEDSVLSFGKPKNSFQKRDKPHIVDNGGAFDDHDIFSNPMGVAGLVKKKKEAPRTDYYDPVRELFEAELEHVQIMQEQERQKIIEEQEIAIERARREEENKIRLAKEHEENQRRLEEEARETALRAEQERLEALRRAEEQKLAREEEKQKIFMEEERRKQAAKQKLLELEARIAKRQSDEAKLNGTQQNFLYEGQKMVERVTSSASSDTSNISMFIDTGSRPTPYVVPPQSFTDRGKSVNIWRSDTVLSGSKGHSLDDNIISRKEYYNGRAVSDRTSREDGFSYNVDGFSYEKQQQRWNISAGDADSFIKDMENDSEFHRDSSDKFRERVWGRPNQGIGDSHSSHSGRVYANSDADVLHSIGRSRYSIRQPRVFPPPLSLPMHKSPQVAEHDFPGSSVSLGGKVRGRSSSENSNYKSNSREGIPADAVLVCPHQNSDIDDYTINRNVFSRCDSQSSLSVSSAPNSPMHLSHDDMEDSTSSMLTVAAEGKDVSLQNTSMDDEIGKKLTAGFSDEWDDKNERLQEQEEYEDDDSCYEEEDEVHEVEGTGNEDLNLLEKNPKEDIVNEVDFSKTTEVGIHEEFEQCIANNEENTFRSAPVSSDMMGIPESHIGVMDHLLPMNDSHQCVSHNKEMAGSGDLGPGQTDDSQSLLPPPSQDSVQAELPVSHSFGLFSGPSMMDSEVPAIQIGSIRMPLHLHHHKGQSLAHVQSSQPPQFQFGQLRCTIPVTQGVIPLNYKPVSSVKPMVTGDHSVTQNVGGALSTDFDKFSSSHSLNSSKSVIPAGYVDRTRGDGSFNTMETEKDNVPLPQGHHLTRSSMARKNVRSESRASVGDGEVSRSVTKMLNNHPSTRTSSRGPLVKHENLRMIGRGRRFLYNRNENPWPSMLSQKESSYESWGYQRRPRRTFPRTEFRVRENIDRGHMMNVNVDDEKSHLSGRNIQVSASNGQMKGPGLSKFTRSTGRSYWFGSGPRSSPYYDIVGNSDKKFTREPIRKKNFHDTLSGTAEDASAPLQTGVACVSEQPGLGHSDGDDFIEVRSKKQVLNDRRKQKAKEIKAKIQVTKVQLKSQITSPNGVFSVNASKIPQTEAEIRKNNVFSGLVVNEDCALINAEECRGFNNFSVSQALPPIGTPPLNTENKDVISLEARRSPPQVNSISGNAPEILPLTQSQFDEAMKPAHYETRAVSLGFHTSPVSEQKLLPSSSTVMKENPFGSTSTSLDPILAGEKIQFGAVTPPQVIPPNVPAIAHAIGSSRLEIPLHTMVSPSQTECPILQNSFVCLDECGVDAEAAASAVAVAAISCDDTVLPDLGSHTSLSNVRSYGVVGISGISSAEDIVGQQISEKFLPEASMSVSLPADLSVEASPISLWPPPLASPHNSSGQVLSHFPGAAPSQFQIFDMNQMGGTPVFSFDPHDDLSRSQSQTPNCVSSSGPLGQWQQQHHNGVDSVYGSSTKFSGSFINPHGGIPNGHGPAHMVVYNHFSPVGQFGQMGLSFVGTTYIPSGKQPDWQHNPTSSALGSSGSNENGGALGSVNAFPAQHNSSNAPPMQHLAPGSPLLPMDSSLQMFDIPPFQGGPVEMGGWPHHHQVHASSSHPQPVSVPTHLHHHHPPTSLPSPFTVRPSPPSLPETRPPFPIPGPAPPPDSSINPFQEKLVLVQPPLPPKDFSGRNQSVRATTAGESKRQNAPVKSQQQQQQYGFGYPRGHRESGEWLHQGRMATSGFQGRHTAKVVRQIYVAKQSGVPSKHV